MNVLDLIVTLPNEIKFCIFNFIDIDTRIEFIKHKYNSRVFNEYRHAITTETNIKLFKRFIQNKLLESKQNIGHNGYTWKTMKVKSHITDLCPSVSYVCNSRTNVINHGLIENIRTKASLQNIPIYGRSLEHKRFYYILDRSNDVYNMFSTISGCDKRLIYVLKKTLLHYMIAVIYISKKEVIKKKIANQHRKIKQWMKRDLPKPLKSAVKKYEKRVKKRILEKEKLAKKLEKEKIKVEKKKLKEQSKMAKNRKKQIPSPKIVIIRRKKVLLS